MKTFSIKIKNQEIPVTVQKDRDSFYVAECKIFEGCYSQGKTIKKALENIKEVITLCLEEKNLNSLNKNSSQKLIIDTSTI